METKFRIVFDSEQQYDNELAQFLDSNIELGSLNFFNKSQNLIKVINGGYEESISSFLFHELYRYENLAYLEQKLYLGSRITPKPDLFFSTNSKRANCFQFCGQSITSYIEFGHHFSFVKYQHIKKTLSDFAKWRDIFNQKNNFSGEIVTIQYITHLTKINSPYNCYCFHNMARRNKNITSKSLYKRAKNIKEVREMYEKTIGTLKKHFVVEYENESIQFEIHGFINIFPRTLTNVDLYNRLTPDIKKLLEITIYKDFWDRIKNNKA